MVTPTKDQIRELATELYMKSQALPTHEGLGETLPEDTELKEDGFWQIATEELMTGDKAKVENELDDYERDVANTLDQLEHLKELEDKSAGDTRKIEALHKQNEALSNRLEEIAAKVGATEKEIEQRPSEPEEEEEEPPPPSPEKAPKPPKQKALITKRKEHKEEIQMAEDKKPTKKVARPKLEHKTKFQIANETLLDLYNKTISLLEEGIKKGATNSPLGLISFMAYVDLLHGGAYTVPITQRPFFINDKSKSPYWTEDLINQDAPQGFMGFLVSIFGGLNAGPLVQEVFEDANCPHVFPKLLSDEMYAYLRAVFAWFTTTNVLKEAGTGVETFVEASTLPIKAVSEAIERVTPSGEQLKQLTPLLSLLGGA